jgi:methylglyoxal/glyoxal reductase
MYPSVTLNNGVEMPCLGLGVYDPKSTTEIRQAVLWAFEMGYRLIDTAAIYKNEDQVGLAMLESGLPRQEMFITTKIWMDDMGYDNTYRAFDESLRKLQTDYIDLYLIHWPRGQAERRSAWLALEKLYADKRVRAIGVSNYYIPHLEEMTEFAGIVPAVNQIELSPYCHPADVLAYCRKHNIQIESYAPLVRGWKQTDQKLINIANKYHKTTYQLLLRWALQQQAIVIPKSVHKERIAANTEFFDFEISTNDMAILNTFHDDTRVAWNPITFE